MTMMKKLLSSVFAAILVVCMTAGVALAGNTPTYVRDHYGLLDADRYTQLESRAESMSDAYNCNVYLTIVDNIGQYSARQYAEAYWNQFDLGRGADKDGIMLLIAVDSRDYGTLTHGQGKTGGITQFTDYRIDQIENDVVAELRNNNWVDGFSAYLNDAQDTMAFYAENGEPWDSNNDPGDAEMRLLIKLAFVIILPIVIAAFICIKWRADMKTAREKTEANDYFERGSLVLTVKQDRFLNTTRTMVKIEQPKSGGGGSSISSSGFGGSGGGKF